MTSGCNAQHRAHQPLCFLTSLGTLTFKVPVIFERASANNDFLPLRARHRRSTLHAPPRKHFT